MIIKDQLNTVLTFPSKPKRIVSLVPSQTELLCQLGLRAEMLGITKFCVHPSVVYHSVERVGGTKDVNIQKVFELKPDIVIANKEENTKQTISKIREFCQVYISDVSDIPSALGMIADLGQIFEVEIKAREITDQIRKNFSELKSVKLNNISTLYFIWNNPYMLAGTDTFINEMLNCCGFQNCLIKSGRKGLRYPALSSEEIIQHNPELILLSSEPYPFTEKHQKEFENILPSAKIIRVDGEYFSWYGSRLIEAPEYFKKVIASV